MQIHELNTFTGELNNLTFAVVDDGSDTGKISVPNLLKDVTEAIDAANDRIDNIISGPAPSEAEIIDARHGADGVAYPSLGDSIRAQVENLDGEISDNWNLYHDDVLPLKLADMNFRNIGINNDGTIIESSYPKELISDLIKLPNNCNVYLKMLTTTNLSSYSFYYYKSNGTFLRSITYAAGGMVFPGQINSADADQVRIRLQFLVDTLPAALEGNLQVKLKFVKNTVRYSSGKNKFNPNDENCLDGYYIGSSTGGLQSSSTYGVTGFIPVKKDEQIVISPRFRQFLFYDANLRPDSNYWVPSAQSNYVFTPPADGYIRFSFYANQKGQVQVENGSTPTTYEPFELKAQDGINFVNSVTKSYIDDEIDDKISGDIVDYSIGNVLYKKKWAVCGDSFTEGVLGTTIGEGRYSGYSVVYPYLIGNRNDMEIVKFFAGGRTLAYPADGTFHNSLTDPTQAFYYQNIPADADYITIYLGINDSHHDSGGGDDEDPTGVIDLGTINDNTTATYYGAWNVVLSWLIENRPFAHIGIIVSNGCDYESYRTAQIEIARKYGIPFIDLNGDDRTPVMIRSKNPNIAAAVKTLVNNKQRVSSSNYHPNDDAHRYESTFIEDFLRTL
jgi:lysophospholipase L1-like esterase